MREYTTIQYSCCGKFVKKYVKQCLSASFERHFPPLYDDFPILVPGNCIASLSGHSGYIYSVAISSGSEPVAVTGGMDGIIRLWNLRYLICDMNWARRKNFCLFISSCLRPGRHDQVIQHKQPYQLTHSSPYSASKTVYTSSPVSALEKGIRVQIEPNFIFQSINLCRIIAAFL